MSDSATRRALLEEIGTVTRRDESVVEEGEGSAWIQWKGTMACMDMRCRCGHMGHLDAEFAYYYRCPSCKQVFSVGQTVRLYPLAGTALEHALGSMCLHTCELEGEEGDMMEDWNGP